jgi:hypothetical protein
VKENYKIGIYGSNRYWQPIMCGTDQFSNYDLWWPRYDNLKNFNSFTPFGGWNQPYMKQYTAEVPICCCPDTDLDWRNSF